MSATLLVRARRIVTPNGVVENGAVLVDGERIVAVDRADLIEVPAEVNVRDCDILLPGFIDMHVHGAGGYGFGGGTQAAREAARAMASAGMTTCYAGLGAGTTLDDVSRSVAGAAQAAGETAGARLAGIFLEGPFISPAKKGAWTAANLRTPVVDELHQLIAASDGQLRRVNVAPELPGALSFIREARARGIVVSIGHSNATYEEAVAGIEAGATIANHTYNAMSPLDHRSPGMAGAVLTRAELLAELILDLVHVHAAAAAALLRARGTSGVALITDGSMLAGQPDGTYESGGRTLIVNNHSCRLPDDTLAGSVARFDEGVRNAARLLQGDLTGLTAISSTNAAKAMGIGGEAGSLTAGHYADLVLLTEKLAVLGTWCADVLSLNRRSRCMTEKRPVRVAVIGCGLVAQRSHLPAYVAASEAELTAVVSGHRETAEVCARVRRSACALIMAGGGH